MEAREIVKAIRMKHRKTAAFVPEITLTDDYYHQTVLRQNPSYKEYAKRKGLLNDDYVVDDTYDMAKGKYARRIDLLMLDKQKWTAIEIKVSRADFFRDTAEKRRVWKEHSHRFIYATPQGLVRAEEIPDGCGWWEITPTGRVVVSKKARVNKERREFPDSFVRTMFWRLATTR